MVAIPDFWFMQKKKMQITTDFSRKVKYPEKASDLPQITDKLYHIMLYSLHLAMCGIHTHNSKGSQLTGW
jgi:hypothetical protein